MVSILELGEADEIYNNPIHPYTKSLLSAVPQPNPDYERNRVRIPYKHEEIPENAEVLEARPGHFVLATKEQLNKLDECLILMNKALIHQDQYPLYKGLCLLAFCDFFKKNFVC